MKDHVFSDSSWAIKLADVWKEHGFVERLNLAARVVRLIWHVQTGASTIQIKKHSQETRNGQTPE